MAGVSSSGPISAAWVAYRKFACTSVYQKGIVDRLTKQSLWLGIAGAVLATFGQQIVPNAPKDATLALLYKAPGMLGAAAVALAAYMARQAFAPDRIRAWTRARTAAESLKSVLFLYRTSTPPFDGTDRSDQLLTKVQKVLDDMKDVETRPHDNKPEPPSALTAQEYATQRCDDQIEFYERRAKEHQSKADLCRKVTAILGGVSALLALAAAIQAVSAWAAVIATVTASITAHMKNQQYQMLVTTYQATAMRLRLLKGKYSGKIDTDAAERNAFVTACEDTMAAENGAWAALWSQKEAPKA